MVNTDILYDVIFFFIFSVIGYICETIYCSVPAHRFINRGFLHGPYIPIYGFGGLLIYKLPSLNSFGPVAFFIGAFILTSILEYFTSWIMEVYFHTKLWDYSKKFANINGRVCLQNSLLFGVMGTALIYLIKPRLFSHIFDIPEKILAPSALTISIIMSFDFAYSVTRMTAFRKQVELFNSKRYDLEAQLKSYAINGSIKTYLETELEEQREKLRKISTHYLKSFPTMTSSNKERRQTIEKLRKNFEETFKKRLKR